ncbi:MAG: glutamate racemase [Candidatus Eiseniibacteriota bacterium]
MSATAHDARPLGVFDSGIGGLTVVRELLALLPDEEIVYFGDVARLPYGNKSPEAVTRFSREITAFLIGQGVKAIVVACNTATALALPALVSELEVPVVGVIESGARAAAARTKTGRVGVIATASTVRSGAYGKALRALKPELAITERACPLFVPLVEEGWITHPVTRQVAHEYLTPLEEHDADTLILGCTHYPLLKPVIAEEMGSKVRLIDSGEETARTVLEMLEAKGLRAPAGRTPRHALYLSDLPVAFRPTAERFLGRELPPVEVVPSPG